MTTPVRSGDVGPRRGQGDRTACAVAVALTGEVWIGR